MSGDTNTCMPNDMSGDTNTCMPNLPYPPYTAYLPNLPYPPYTCQKITKEDGTKLINSYEVIRGLGKGV